MKYTTTRAMACILTVGALATGCQTTSILTAPVNQPITSEVLQAHNWQLVDAKRSDGEQMMALFFDATKPLTLSFMSVDGSERVAFINTCNNMSAGYSVDDGEVALGHVLSTMMACPEPWASFDTATLATVQGKYSLNYNANHVPILTVKNDEQVAYFKAVAK